MVLYARSGNANFKSKEKPLKQLAFKIEVAFIGLHQFILRGYCAAASIAKQVTDKNLK
jgi:hypothetical protein